MEASEQKIVQYLAEAKATEDALVRVLQSQIAMTPSGSYRSALDTHLTETRRHSKRVSDRLEALGAGGNPLMVAVGFWENRRRPGPCLEQDPVRPAARLRRRGEGTQERQGRLRDRGVGDRDLYRHREVRARGR